MATLKDISKKTNLSITTISRILKNDKTLNVNESTREKVLKVANELNYKVKQASLGRKIIIINWYSHDQEIIDPYYYYIRKSVQENCKLLGISYDILYKEDSINKVNNYDGIIAIGKFSLDETKKLDVVSDNIIFIDSNPNRNKYDSVEVDFDNAMKEIIQYIKSIQETEVGLMMGKEFINSQKYDDQRTIAYKKHSEAAGFFNKRYNIEGDFTVESGYKMFMQLYKEKRLPKVIICGNDLIAMGANKAAYKCGLEIGKDINLIGINDIPISKYIVPSLTTVHIHQKQMGKEAVLLLNRRFEDNGTKITIYVPTYLKVRKSTKS